ncbi:helix-turn-helix domain-containing protein [Mesorhizobium marinum]|uniref:helix-turn-helix domain-containing protein n=1 Tax=Mesorhizobium marinum TaxID=3228790 RepID=UPI0034664D20
MQRLSIERIEDLKDAVQGAGLQATQMSRAPVTGSLVFSDERGILCSSGLLRGDIALAGPLSNEAVTLGLGVRLPPGSWHWLTEVESGEVGIFHAGDEHDCFYTPGAIYAAVTLSLDRLEEEAFREDLVLDRNLLGGTGIHCRKIAPDVLVSLTQKFEAAHAGRPRGNGAGKELLLALINHLGRPPYDFARRMDRSCHARVVELARAYVLENLTEPISLDALADAARTSRRTLSRAFNEILDDTPQGYVRRLRLHRIRQHLADDAERACTIALIANEWGMSDLGRMAGWYRDLFGELPSETLLRTKFKSAH